MDNLYDWNSGGFFERNSLDVDKYAPGEKSFEIIEKDGKDVLFRAEVQGGTYIRKLIDDLGKELGVGAHMLELRRTKAGIFSEEDIQLVSQQAGVDEEKAKNALEEAKGDLARAILLLTTG